MTTLTKNNYDSWQDRLAQSRFSSVQVIKATPDDAVTEVTTEENEQNSFISDLKEEWVPVWRQNLDSAYAELQSLQDKLNHRAFPVSRAFDSLIGERDYKLKQYLNEASLAMAKVAPLNTEDTLKATDRITEIVSALSLPVSMPDNDFWKKITEAIALVDEQYLSIYEYVVGRQTEYWRLYSELQHLTAPEVKDKKYIVNTELITELEKLLFLKDGVFKTGTDKSFILYPKQDSSTSDAPATTTKEEAEKWRQELGLPNECVVQAEDGQYVIVVDYSPIQKIYDLCHDSNHKPKLTFNDPAEYNAWYTSVKSHVDNLQSTCTTITTKYSNANSVYDTIIKVLSSTITSMLDANKALLSNIR